MPAPRGRRTIQAASAVGAVLLIAALAPVSAAAAPGPRLSVDATAHTHAISPLIYGLNYADPATARELRLPIDRWGGNTTDTYNYTLGSSNTGLDYYFENIPDCWDAAYGYCANHQDIRAYRTFIDADRAVGSETLLTLPMMGRIASDAGLDHPFTCGFPASVFPSQDSFDPYDSNCGSGTSGGSELAADPNRDSIPTPSGYIPDWIAKLRSLYGSAANGGVGYYELGNEPALWDSTHRDMHPQATTYDELATRMSGLAKQVKSADPGAKTLGPAEWGWPNYFCSAADDTSDGCTASDADRAAHGGTPIVPWLLARMKAASQQAGKRLLDYLDLHYYAQGGNSTDVTRSLWDPTYKDPSWIDEAIDLIPRMRAWVGNNYPGTGIALSEYNLSVGDARTNALIQADTLGIFAREQVDIATRWPLAGDGGQITNAFRIYRNYDGKGGAFGNVWVDSKSADQGRLAVYGAKRTGDGRLTVVVINKSGAPLTSALSIAHFASAGSAQAYEWTGGAIARSGDSPIIAGSLQRTYPARSITMLVIAPKGAPPPPPSPAPDTAITKVKVKGKKKRARVSFTGSGGSGTLSFRCELDEGGYAACASPATFRHLKKGRHKVRVEAVDSSGKADPTPAAAKFKVPRAHKKHRHHKHGHRRHHRR